MGIPLGGVTTLNFTISNLNYNTALTGIGFTDNLPAGLAVATPSYLSSTCGGTATATGGSNQVSLSGAMLTAASFCEIAVNVIGTQVGIWTNNVAVFAYESGTAINTSSASITVALPTIPETATVNDQVTLTALVNVTAPVVNFSAGSIGFGTVASGQTGAQLLAVSNSGLAPLLLTSVSTSGSAAFSVSSQVACSNGATTLPTTLPSGGLCTFTISYTAPVGGGAVPTGMITFTDNAALSNVTPSTLMSGNTYTQSIALSGTGSDMGAPPLPPATVSLAINETITGNDQVAIAPTINVAAPVVNFSAGNIGFGTVASDRQARNCWRCQTVGWHRFCLHLCRRPEAQPSASPRRSPARTKQQHCRRRFRVAVYAHSRFTTRRHLGPAQPQAESSPLPITLR